MCARAMPPMSAEGRREAAALARKCVLAALVVAGYGAYLTVREGHLASVASAGIIVVACASR